MNRLLRSVIRRIGSRSAAGGAPAGERGSVLVMALVCVVVLSLTLSAVFGLQDTTMRAHGALERAEQQRAVVDGALDHAIHALRFAPDAGVNWDLLSEAACSDLPGGGSGFTYRDASTGLEVEVECRALPGSRTFTTGGRPPDEVLFATGGVLGDGDDASDGDPDDDPFCDDRHTPPDAPACESGIHVGYGTSESGLTVVRNGGESTVLVRSNGAITAGVANPSRVLNVVDGTSTVGVVARRACRNVRDDGTLLADDATAHPGCRGAHAHAGGIPAGALVTHVPMADIPEYRHAYWSRAEIVRPGELLGDRYPATNEPNVSGHEAPERRPSSHWDSCADGVWIFEPGTYAELAALNSRMESCPEALYWFKPGVYLFDFEDVGASALRYWREPLRYTQIVGGKPNGWLPRCENDLPGYDTVSTSPRSYAACEQPVKTMVPNKLAYTNWNGTDADEDDDTDSAVPGSPQSALRIDGRWAQTTITTHENAELRQTALRTPLPATARPTQVVLRVRHRVPDIEHLKDRTPEVKVLVGSDSSATCAVWLAHPGATDGAGKVFERPDTQETVIDLTDGCPTDEGGVSGAAFPSGAGWTAARVNDLKAHYRVRRDISIDTDPSTSGTQPPTPLVEVDGMELDVDYVGPPSPSFPNGCEADFDEGVQWIFANLSRVQWSGNSVYAELCASAIVGGEHTDPRAIALYGLTHQTAPPARRYATGHTDPGRGIWPRTAYDATASAKFAAGYGGPCVPSCALVSDDTAVEPFEAEDDQYAAADWSDGQAAKLVFALPSDTVPAGSAIERVMFRLRYATPKTASNPQRVTRVRIRVDKGSTAADPSDPDAHGGTSGYLAHEPPLHDVATVASAADYGAVADAGKWATFELGDDWPDESGLTSLLRTSPALNGARITVEFQASGAHPAQRKIALVEAAEVVVQYRPPGTLRPLRGCMTIRTRRDPGDPYAPHRRYTGVMSVPSDLTPDGTYDATQYIHWGAPFVSTTDDAGSMNNVTDARSCALFTVRRGSTGLGSRLHIQGVVYAPTAAVEFDGNDNDAPFVTDGVVARHIMATRWKRGPEIAPFGVSDRPRGPGRFRLTVRLPGGAVHAEAVVTITPSPLVGAPPLVRIDRWIRRPEFPGP